MAGGNRLIQSNRAAADSRSRSIPCVERLTFDRLHQLEPVAERVLDVAARPAGKRRVRLDATAGRFEPVHEGGEVVNFDRRTRFPRRSEVGFAAEVDLGLAAEN